MTQPPENGPDAQTEPLGAVPPEPQPVVADPASPAGQAPQQSKSSNTRTILEIVGGVVAVGAIFMAGILGFGLGLFAGTHKHHSDDDRLPMMMHFDDNGDGNRQGAPDLRDFFGGGGDTGPNGGQQAPALPDDLQQWLEQFGEGLRQGMGGDSGGAIPSPPPSTPPSS